MSIPDEFRGIKFVGINQPLSGRLMDVSPSGRRVRLYARGELAGVLRYADGHWTFHGNADDAAQAFFDALALIARPEEARG